MVGPTSGRSGRSARIARMGEASCSVPANRRVTHVDTGNRRMAFHNPRIATATSSVSTPAPAAC
jgi:hypothetical protein